MYPINKLVAEEILKLGISKRELVARMGYKNINNGLSNLHNFLFKSYYTSDYLKNILNAISIDEQTLEIAKYGTEEIIRLEKELESEKMGNNKIMMNLRWEIKHLPYLHRKTEPESPYEIRFLFCTFKLTQKFIFLNKSILGLAEPEQIEILSQIIKNDYKKNIEVDNYFQRIKSYVFHKDPETKIEFNIDGRPINQTR